ncbi:flagellar hook assembly protein FlgD [Marinobacterium lutimaris]|uniref:Basal-body rod modification protein FlgD n=1 Tax=Marinobacterium lutimaris TaxID=568106 RepID=A0A1H6BDA2_9GAMM|nr:flagellar hook capping FlgD N-terminal domain-containing protein [Marinobacterium lutimaris]SEG58748.1 flagellar basal-body rod modification protein FlgD [Marinobacterium lutimaris]
MSTVNGVGNNNVYDQINQANQSGANTEQSQSAQDSQMFMELMIAQLQNQDPTNPADTTDFMQQIATMSQVESLNTLVSTVEDMSNSMLSSQAALQASSMVGQTVFTEGGDKTLYQEGSYARGMVSLDASAPNVSIEIYDANGQLVSTASMGNLEAGDHDFVWGGEGYPAGEYSLVAKSTSGDGITEVPIFTGQTVNSVSLGQNGIGMRVNTDAGSFSMNDIRQIG